MPTVASDVGPKKSLPSSMNGRRWAIFFGIAITLIALDQLSKCWVVSHLTSAMLPEGEALSFAERVSRFWTTVHPYPLAERVLVPQWLKLQYVENPGAAWGVLSHSDWHFRTPFFLVLAIVAMGFLLHCTRVSKPHQWLLRFAFSIVFGGAVGNFIDRVRLGYVVDFIDCYVAYGYHWPTFNVADAGITIGFLLLMGDATRERAPKL